MKIFEKITQKNLDGIIISDPKNIFYLTGFSGSFGILLLKKSNVINIRYESNTSEANLMKVLQLAGLEKESTTDCHSYKFYVREMPLFVLMMRDCAEKGNIERVGLRTDLGDFPPKID